MLSTIKGFRMCTLSVVVAVVLATFSRPTTAQAEEIVQTIPFAVPYLNHTVFSPNGWDYATEVGTWINVDNPARPMYDVLSSGIELEFAYAAVAATRFNPALGTLVSVTIDYDILTFDALFEPACGFAEAESTSWSLYPTQYIFELKMFQGTTLIAHTSTQMDLAVEDNYVYGDGSDTMGDNFYDLTYDINGLNTETPQYGLELEVQGDYNVPNDKLSAYIGTGLVDFDIAVYFRIGPDDVLNLDPTSQSAYASILNTGFLAGVVRVTYTYIPAE